MFLVNCPITTILEVFANIQTNLLEHKFEIWKPPKTFFFKLEKKKWKKWKKKKLTKPTMELGNWILNIPQHAQPRKGKGDYYVATPFWEQVWRGDSHS